MYILNKTMMINQEFCLVMSGPEKNSFTWNCGWDKFLYQNLSQIDQSDHIKKKWYTTLLCYIKWVLGYIYLKSQLLWVALYLQLFTGCLNFSDKFSNFKLKLIEHDIKINMKPKPIDLLLVRYCIISPTKVII